MPPWESPSRAGRRRRRPKNLKKQQHQETAADDDGIVDTTDEVALLQSENNDLREEVAELKRSSGGRGAARAGHRSNRLQEGEEDKYEVCEEDDGWVGEGVHRRKRLTWDAFCEKHERAVRTVKMRWKASACVGDIRLLQCLRYRRHRWRRQLRAALVARQVARQLHDQAVPQPRTGMPKIKT